MGISHLCGAKYWNCLMLWAQVLEHSKQSFAIFPREVVKCKYRETTSKDKNYVLRNPVKSSTCTLYNVYIPVFFFNPPGGIEKKTRVSKKNFLTPKKFWGVEKNFRYFFLQPDVAKNVISNQKFLLD